MLYLPRLVARNKPFSLLKTSRSREKSAEAIVSYCSNSTTIFKPSFLMHQALLTLDPQGPWYALPVPYMSPNHIATRAAGGCREGRQTLLVRPRGYPLFVSIVKGYDLPPGARQKPIGDFSQR